MKRITINRPDDWHVHFRQGDALSSTVPATSKHFARALVMPNLMPPLCTLESIRNYREDILAAIPKHHTFKPYMTFYLNQSVTAEAIEEASHIDYVTGAKLYPAGATTNSEQGARSLDEISHLLEVLQDKDMVLQIHGETTSGDIFAREKQFIETYLHALRKRFPALRIVLEHISTQAAVEFVEANERIAATVTPQHLLYNRNQLLSGGIRPHYYCLPILKHERDQQAVQAAVCSQNPKFFAGSDSAPHPKSLKESACGCAGIFSAPFALALYTQFFDSVGRLDCLNDFMSRFGAEFYQLPCNQETIEIIAKPQSVPESLPFADDRLVPIAASEQISWSIHESE